MSAKGKQEPSGEQDSSGSQSSAAGPEAEPSAEDSDTGPRVDDPEIESRANGASPTASVRLDPRSTDSKADLDLAFEGLYRDHLRDVYSYSYYRVGNHHDAEDLTEQTFLQAYRHFERARRESRGRPLRPWLIRIAHNLASNFHRDRARRPASSLDVAEPVPHPFNTEDVVESREELRRVIQELDGLSDDRREALIMRFALGMSNREIARALGRTDGATKVLIHRGIKQLEGRMIDHEPGAGEDTDG